MKTTVKTYGYEGEYGNERVWLTKDIRVHWKERQFVTDDPKIQAAIEESSSFKNGMIVLLKEKEQQKSKQQLIKRGGFSSNGKDT